MTDKRQARTATTLLGLVLLAAASAGLVWLLQADGDGAGVARAAGAVVSDSGTRDETLLRPGQSAAPETVAGRREATSVEAAAAPAQAASRKPKEVPLDTEGATVVRVRLVDPEGAALPLAGVQVEIQSWLEDTSDTYRHSVVTDANGVGSIAFEGMVHVDWFKHEPSFGAGLPFLYSEHHQDVDAGDEWSEVLVVTEGGRVTGRVVDTTGAPVSGCAVHLFQEYYMGEVADVWRPGVTHTTSDQRGVFTFDSLAAIGWSLAIPPFEVLQIEPSLVNGAEERSFIEVEAGETVDVGTFVVAPLERLEVSVVDLEGAPVAEALVRLEPRVFSVPGLSVESDEKVDVVDLWLRGENPWSDDPTGEHAWTYDYPSATTGADGRAKVLATSGSWTLHVRSTRDVGGEPVYDEALDVTLPHAPLVVSVAARFQAVAGRVVDHAGKPVDGVRVVASESSEHDASGLVATSDERGVFRFAELPLGRPLWFHLRSSGSLPAVHPAVRHEAPQPAEELDPEGLPRYVVRRAARLNVGLAFVGERNRTAWLRIRPRTLATLEPALTPVERRHAEALRAEPVVSSAIGQGKDRLRVSGLLPGAYEVSVMVVTGTGAYHAKNGAPVTEYEPWQTETFETDDASQVFTIDLSGYTYPQNQPGVRWSGVLRSAGGGEFRGRAWIELQGDGWSRSTWTRSSGEFAVDCPDAAFVLRVSAQGFAQYSRSMPVAGTLGSGVVVELEPCATEVALHVRDEQGAPVPSTRIQLFDAQDEPARAHLGNWRDWKSTGWTQGKQPLVARYLRPGRWKVTLRLEELDLEPQWIDVRDTPARQDVTLELPFTTDELRARLRAAREDS